MKDSTISHKWMGWLAIGVLMLGWQVAAAKVNLPLILPTPGAALRQIGVLLTEKTFWHHLCATLLRGAFGFLFAFISGAALGLAAGKNAWLSAFLRPFTVFIRSTPSMTLIILGLLWFKGDLVTFFVIFFVVFPLVVRNMEDGTHALDPQLEEMVTVYQVKPWRRFRFFYVPGIMPFLAAAATSGLGITWKVLIAAEVLAYPAWGIGTQLETSRLYLQTDKVFAWTVIVVTIGLLFDYGLDYLLQISFRGRKEDEHG